MMVDNMNGKCMLCGSDKLSFYHTLRDDNERNAYKCEQCGHIQVSPLPTLEEDDKYYRNDRMYKDMFSEYEHLQQEENLMMRFRDYNFDEAENIKHFVSKNERIFDIGTGFGWFVRFLRDDGYTVDGLEISDEKRELAKKVLGLDLFGWNFMLDDTEAIEKSGYYDTVCMQQTLEHISDPIVFVKKSMRFLRPNGKIIISVPNENDMLKEIEPAYTDYHYLRAHLSYFTPEMLKSLLVDCGLKDVEIYGHQVYSIENHIGWTRTKKPYKDAHQIYLPDSLEWINKVYKAELEKRLRSNTIVAVAYKG
jgi:2-polyprenyl-3-methyl-5-hydroxy-6-metoxy-1,4-benzoquinol methylase